MPRQSKSPVIFAGENPGLSLYGPNGGGLVAAASYWRCTYSPHGEGNVLVLWLDLAGAGLGQGELRAIFTDNAPMARFVTDTLNQHFGDYQPRDFPSVQPQPARFFQESDSRHYHRVVCHGADHAVELVWRDVRDRQMVIGSDLTLGGRSFELATVICPCAGATLTLDGKPAAGEVRLSERDGRPQSSAFLAFAESWVDNGPAAERPST
jgi:hypothetical protein